MNQISPTYRETATSGVHRTNMMSELTLKDDTRSKNPVRHERSGTSEPSHVSFKSDWSMELPNTFKTNLPSEHIPAQHERSDISEPSHVSFKSDCEKSENPTPQHIPAKHERLDSSEPSHVSFKSDHSMELPNTLQTNPPSKHINVQKTRITSASAKIKEADVPVEEVICVYAQNSQVSTFNKGPIHKHTLKTLLKNRFQHLYNALQDDGHTTLLNDIYTELYITEGEDGEINNEHEVRQIENLMRIQQSAEDIPIKCNDIFKPLPGLDKPIRTVLTNGVAGIGKTVSVQKFILDWAEDKANQDIHFLFPLPFRELNILINHEFSIETLVHYFFPQLKEMKFTNLLSVQIVFIFDGLDECLLPLDFQNTARVSDVTTKTSLGTLLINLIKGYLLPMAVIWITSRPAAASRIPIQCIDKLTELRGFNDQQKEEYFSKRIIEPSLNNKIITHLKSSRSLYIMCHIPVFCWISAAVLEKMLQESEDGVIPKTLTEMYTHFLIIQTFNRKDKYHGNLPADKEMIMNLGHLAFKQLLKGNLIFYEEDLTDCGITVTDAVLYSGVCTQIFKEECELFHVKRKVFCFVHLSIQEHLAALYVHLSFSEGNKAVLNQWNPSNRPTTFQCQSIVDLHKSAIDKALQSQNGQFDLFLRFLLGLSQERNCSLLQVVLPLTSVCSFQNVCNTIEYIKVRLRMNLTPEKYINLFYCLNELNDFSLEEEIQSFQKKRLLTKTKLSASQWSALVFVLLTSGSTRDVFDPWKYSGGNEDDCLWRMLPVLKASRTAEVRDFTITGKGFQALTSAISSKTSSLRELKLGGTALPLDGIKCLSEGLKSPHCKLELLELSSCDIAEKHWKTISSALKSNLSHLRELNLSFNPLNVVGMIHFTDVLIHPDCALEKLMLVRCQLTHQSCAYLSNVLKSKSKLTELDLSTNTIKDYGVKLLSDGLSNKCCILRSLRLADCRITEQGCISLCKALKSNPSHLRELCLNRNDLTDNGVIRLSDIIKICNLEKLSLSYCKVSVRGCDALAQALEHNRSHLRELVLNGNGPGVPAKTKLHALQQHKEYRLEKL